MSLYGIEMSGLGEGEPVVFLSESFTSGGAAGEGDAEFTSQTCGKGLREHGVEEQGIFFILDVKQFNRLFRAVDGPPAEGPVWAVDFQHAEAIGREAVHEGRRVGSGVCTEGTESGREGPSVRTEKFSTHGVVMLVAESGCGGTTEGNTANGGFSQLGEGEIADAESRGLCIWWCGVHSDGG